MKRTKQFPLILAALSLLFSVSSLYAQDNPLNSAAMSISANATVVTDIELTTMRNINFGKVQPGQQAVDISPTRDARAGKMVATGIPNSQIRVSYISEWQLTNSRTNHTLTFNYRVAASETDNQDTAELLQTQNRDLSFNQEGRYYFWIGGSADISNIQPGNYEGEFTIEIEYI